MELLLAGLFIWIAVHLFPALGAGARAALVQRLGRGPYRGLFSLLIAGAVVCMVLGWRAATPAVAYVPSPSLRPLALALMLPALILFFSSRVPTDIKRFLRHPQLTGVAIWALAHLLANGDSRSLLLFGGLGLWALLEIVVINHREGPWQKPAAAGPVRSLLPVLIGAVAWVGLAFAHPWFAGVPVLAHG